MSVAIHDGGTSPFDALRQIDTSGEYWTARTLQPVMEYSRWEKFAEVVEKAKASLALVQGAEQAGHHFATWGSEGGRWGNQPLADFRLTRFGAYLTAMAGDDTKEAVARARVYFAVKTREAETLRAPVEMTKLEALRAAIESEEGRLAAETRAVEAEQQAAALAPSAKAWDTLADVKGDYSLRDAAFILNRDPNISTGQQRLMKTLRALGMLDRLGIPYAKHAAHLTERPRTYDHPQTGEPVLAKPQIRVTVKGLRYLHGKLDGVAPLRFEQLAMTE